MIDKGFRGCFYRFIKPGFSEYFQTATAEKVSCGMSCLKHC